MSQVSQYANGNVENMVAGDQYIHIHSPELSKMEIWKMRTELLYYKKHQIKDVHYLLCDYVSSHFGTQKIVNLPPEQLAKLYQYHQKLLRISPILVKHQQTKQPKNNLMLIFKRCINLLKGQRK